MRKITFAFGGFGTRGFALPTVLISSVILLTVLAVTVGAVNAARVALQGQHYSQMASEAAEAGLEMARACIADGYLTWNEPLRAGTDCFGSASPVCTGADDCFIASSDNIRTTFEVPGPEISGDISTLRSKGVVELFRESNGSTWKTYTSSIDMQDTVTDVSQGDEVLWRDFTVGGPHTCAISFSDEVYCWGYNSSGQLGDGTTNHSSVPVKIKQGAIPDGVKPESISAGRDFTCIIGSDGWMYCWGINTSGELGNNSRVNSSEPVALSRGAIPAGVTIAKLGKVAQKTNCAIGSNGRAYCWGLNDYGQIGNGTKSATTSIVPVAVSRGAMPADMNVTEITTGSHFSCAIASNARPYCWGYNSTSEGRLGINSTTVSESLTPIAVVRGALPADITVSQIGAGLYHTCAIGSDSKTYCWGRNTQNQMGDNTVTHNIQPAATAVGVMPSGRISTQLGVGLDHACATSSDSWVYCWGMNTNAEGGDGTRNNLAVPSAMMQGAIPSGVTLAKVLGGNVHSCGLGTNSKIYCWGNNNEGRLGDGSTDRSDIPVGVAAVYERRSASTFIKKLTLGTSHTCSVASDGKGYCQGFNASSQLGDGTTVTRTTPTPIARGVMPTGVTILQLVSGSSHTCALGSNNSAYCWGSNSSGQLGDGTTTTRSTPVAVARGAMPTGVTIRQLTAGSVHTCAIGSNSKAYCWGFNSSGQLGDGTTVRRLTPTLVSAGAMGSSAAIRQIESSSTYTCAINFDGKLFCWGSNTSNQLGDGTTTDRTAPVAVARGAIPTGATARQVSVGVTHTCASMSNSQTYCWGANNFGQLGDETTTARPLPTLVSRGAMPVGAVIRQMSVGSTYTCAVASDNKLYCWGVNTSSQLGDGTTTARPLPTAVAQGTMSTGAAVRRVSTGTGHTCATTSDNKAYCWGYNGYGQLGSGTTANSTVPSAIAQGAAPTATVVQQVVASANTCTLAANSQAYCWGGNSAGQLGDGTAINRSTPATVVQGAIPSGVMISQLVANGHTCALASNNQAYCWGTNFYGQLGNGAAGDKSSPVAVVQGALSAGVAIRQIAIGSNHTCATASDGQAYCWGFSYFGQLGNGATGSIGTNPAPVAVSRGSMPAGVTLQRVTAGQYHTCGLGSNGQGYCWGFNDSGQLGDGTTANKSTPVAVSRGAMPAGITVRQLVTNADTTCALASNNQAYCWGLNGSGQLGDGTIVNKSTPVAVSRGAMPTSTTVRQVVTGGGHTCALASNNQAYCWGLNGSGQLGDGTTTNRTTPVAVSQGMVPSGSTIRELVAGDNHTCALTATRAVYCWGSNGLGQLGNGTVSTAENRTSPVPADFIADPTSLPSYLLVGPRHYF